MLCTSPANASAPVPAPPAPYHLSLGPSVGSRRAGVDERRPGGGSGAEALECVDGRGEADLPHSLFAIPEVVHKDRLLPGEQDDPGFCPPTFPPLPRQSRGVGCIAFVVAAF